ncbi:MAG TPA: ABC transporter substrate-binding protein [Gammaproteobacteria bacterium]|nr:ABC transporter substrate-binding protein [Gammaproteobacteria bacterium]
MIRRLFFIAAFYLGFSCAGAVASEHLPGRISVGYLVHWPTPALFAQAKNTFDYALGVEVDWRPFTDGNEMNDAMAKGEIQIAYAQGQVPFLVGVSRGLDLTMVGVAAGYAEDDNCILRGDVGIDRNNAAQLAGKKVALHRGSLSHFRMLGVLKYLRVDPATIEIVDVGNGDEAAAALVRGEVVMACAGGSSLRAMEKLGKPLMSGAEQSEIGLKVFDAVTVAGEFVHQHPELIQAFMDILDASNKQWKKNPEPMIKEIARVADMDRMSARRALAGFTFPSALEQKSDAWLGGDVVDYSKELADFFVAEGQLPRALESYDRFITTRFLR